MKPGKHSILRRFADSRDGNFALMMAVAAIPLVLAVGFSADYTMAIQNRSGMQNALDAATLSIVNMPKTATNEEREVKLKEFYTANGGPGTAKLESFGAERILACERGASFGYNTLVSDMRALPQLAATGWPVVFDATHSVQQPGGLGGTSGGQREYVPVLARAAVAVGVAAVFIETHEDPENAPSDGPNMVPLKDMPRLLEKLLAFDAVAKG